MNVHFIYLSSVIILAYSKREIHFYDMVLRISREKASIKHISLGFPRKIPLCSICALGFIIKLMPGPMSSEF